MSDQYIPEDAEQRAFRSRLDQLILWALRRVCDRDGQETALAVAERIDSGEWRLMTQLDLDADGNPDLHALWFKVEVRAPHGEWVELAKAHWSTFGISEQGAAEEAMWTARQHGYGIPDDPGELADEDPPS